MLPSVRRSPRLPAEASRALQVDPQLNPQRTHRVVAPLSLSCGSTTAAQGLLNQGTPEAKLQIEAVASLAGNNRNYGSGMIKSVRESQYIYSNLLP